MAAVQTLHVGYTEYPHIEKPRSITFFSTTHIDHSKQFLVDVPPNVPVDGGILFVHYPFSGENLQFVENMDVANRILEMGRYTPSRVKNIYMSPTDTEEAFVSGRKEKIVVARHAKYIMVIPIRMGSVSIHVNQQFGRVLLTKDRTETHNFDEMFGGLAETPRGRKAPAPARSESSDTAEETSAEPVYEDIFFNDEVGSDVEEDEEEDEDEYVDEEGEDTFPEIPIRISATEATELPATAEDAEDVFWMSAYTENNNEIYYYAAPEFTALVQKALATMRVNFNEVPDLSKPRQEFVYAALKNDRKTVALYTLSKKLAGRVRDLSNNEFPYVAEFPFRRLPIEKFAEPAVTTAVVLETRRETDGGVTRSIVFVRRANAKFPNNVINHVLFLMLEGMGTEEKRAFDTKFLRHKLRNNVYYFVDKEDKQFVSPLMWQVVFISTPGPADVLVAGNPLIPRNIALYKRDDEAQDAIREQGFDEDNGYFSRGNDIRLILHPQFNKYKPIFHTNLDPRDNNESLVESESSDSEAFGLPESDESSDTEHMYDGAESEHGDEEEVAGMGENSHVTDATEDNEDMREYQRYGEGLIVVFRAVTLTGVAANRWSEISLITRGSTMDIRAIMDDHTAPFFRNAKFHRILIGKGAGVYEMRSSDPKFRPEVKWQVVFVPESNIRAMTKYAISVAYPLDPATLVLYDTESALMGVMNGLEYVQRTAHLYENPDHRMRMCLVGDWKHKNGLVIKRETLEDEAGTRKRAPPKRGRSPAGTGPEVMDVEESLPSESELTSEEFVLLQDGDMSDVIDIDSPVKRAMLYFMFFDGHMVYAFQDSKDTIFNRVRAIFDNVEFQRGRSGRILLFMGGARRGYVVPVSAILPENPPQMYAGLVQYYNEWTVAKITTDVMHEIRIRPSMSLLYEQGGVYRCDDNEKNVRIMFVPFAIQQTTRPNMKLTTPVLQWKGRPLATVGFGLSVRTSNIPGAGLGLFADRNFQEGDFITQFDGEIVSSQVAQELRRQNRATHVITLVPKHTAIAGITAPAAGRGGASLANDAGFRPDKPYKSRKNNAKFEKVSDSEGINETVLLRATKTIQIDDEITVSYEPGYWNLHASSENE